MSHNDFSNPSLQDFFHPGQVEPTERLKRYGKELSPRKYDTPGHTWHLAKEKNWGPWSCCGNPVNSKGCTARSKKQAVEAKEATFKEFHDRVGSVKYIRFIKKGNICKVVGEDKKCWLLDTGRVAKKKTQGKVWIWCDVPTET